ncbi:hypothetical protein HBZS_118130 [Helicobacter bizzozeronii CCUG 35545]|nr:hypothetical protein HBZS_118130 [Helicobacter bizzozeronii CCUG 35545]
MGSVHASKEADQYYLISEKPLNQDNFKPTKGTPQSAFCNAIQKGF